MHAAGVIIVIITFYHQKGKTSDLREYDPFTQFSEHFRAFARFHNTTVCFTFLTQSFSTVLRFLVRETPSFDETGSFSL
jgi:hypothetical protein